MGESGTIISGELDAERIKRQILESFRQAASRTNSGRVYPDPIGGRPKGNRKQRRAAAAKARKRSKHK